MSKFTIISEFKAGDQVVIDSLPPMYNGIYKVGDNATVSEISTTFMGWLTFKGDEITVSNLVRFSDVSNKSRA